MSKKEQSDEMAQQVSAWIKLSIKYLGVAITAAGVSVGTQITDSKTLADHERRISQNERSDEAYHGDCARFRSVDLSGFCDPRIVHAIDQQIQRCLKEYETKERAASWRRRLKQLNPTLTIINSENGD